MTAFEIVRGSVNAQFLRLAVILKLFDRIRDAGHPLTPPILAAETGQPVEMIAALLRNLSHQEMLDHIEPDAFDLNTESRNYLCSDQVGFLGPLLEQTEVDTLPILRSALKAIDQGHRHKAGTEQPKPLSLIDRMRLSCIHINDGDFLSAPAQNAGQELARIRDFSDFKSAVDLGGNDGSFLLQVLKANPGLSGIVADLPGLRERASNKFKQTGLTNRCSFHPLNFFLDPLPAADLYFMGSVLHDWDISTGYFLLRKIHAALPPGGTLVLHEMLLDTPGNEKELWGLHLEFILRSGKCTLHDSSEYSRWLTDNGFKVTGVSYGDVKSFIFATKEGL